MKTILFTCFVSVLFLSLQSCQQEEIEYASFSNADYRKISKHLNVPTYPPEYDVTLPDYLGGTSRAIDDQQAMLGRVLFYDKHLSQDSTIACASCHLQELAFSDNVAFSKGVYDRSTSRNSQALGAVISFIVYYSSSSNSGGVPFFWDNRAFSIQEQSKATLKNRLEMDITMSEVVKRVKEQPYYAPFFKAIYFDEAVDEDKILDALSAFVNSIGSFNSPYDKARGEHMSSEEEFSAFTVSENLGKRIYQENCSTCHGVNFNAPNVLASNNGLAMEYEDQGLGGHTNDNSDMGRFKVPTLRNIALTAPYMHDGSIATLAKVIDHYSNGIQAHRNLSSRLKEEVMVDSNLELVPKKFNFTIQEKRALLDFFETLTDYELITDERFSNPFIY